MAAIGAVILFGVAMRIVRPLLIASHPVLLEFLNGGLAEIGVAAAFARVGEVPLWLVLVAGTAGIMKFDWMTWWAGRRWGPAMIAMFSGRQRADRLTERAQRTPRWLIGLAVVAAPLPGVPGVVMTMLAGWTGMRLRTFLALDALGAFLTTAVVAGIGFAVGQGAVDVVLLIDRYAGWVVIGVIVTMAAVPAFKWLVRRVDRSRRKHPADPTPQPGD